MTKKTIMELLRETNKKAEAEGRYYDMNRLFGHAMRDANDLSFESIEQHVAVHTLDTLERIANALESNANQTQAKSNQTQIKGSLTYHEFFEEFNVLSSEYHAEPVNRGMIAISNDVGYVEASLREKSCVWHFNDSYFTPGELALMKQLAATPPALRGEIEND